MITAAQSRSARTLLGWSVGKLASTASVSESAVDNFELERLPPDPATAKAIQRALEDVGVEFLPIDDVRLRAQGQVIDVNPEPGLHHRTDTFVLGLAVRTLDCHPEPLGGRRKRLCQLRS